MNSSPRTDYEKAKIGTTPYVNSIVNPPFALDETTKGITSEQDIPFYIPAKYSFDTQTKFNKENAVCVNARSPQDIIKLNQQGQEQCGWYYDRQAKVGKGYLSTTENGAIPVPMQGLSLSAPAQPSILYYGKYGPTSLQAAQKRFDEDKCNKMTCSQAGNSTYKGLCGYCMSLTKGIPINEDGSIKYPDINCGGSLANLIVNTGDTSRCPAQPTTRSFSGSGRYDPNSGQVKGNVRRRPLPAIGNCQLNTLTGQFSGACLQSALVSQGCDAEDGSLSLALNGFDGAIDIKSVLKNQPKLAEYINTQTDPDQFSLNRFLSAQTMADAQTQALALSQASSKGQSNAAQSSSDALAIDLCKKSGFYEEYSFCGDLTDSTTIDSQNGQKWDIKCLQKAFIPAGFSDNKKRLRESGSMYPDKENSNAYKFYNTLKTWGAVKAYMQNIYKSINGQGSLKTQIKENFTNPNTVSAEFRLESVNFHGWYVRFLGENKQLIIEKPYDPKDPQSIPKDPRSFLFVWKRGPNNTVIIMPVLNKSLSLYIVKEGRWYMIASSENNHNQFYVQTGNAGTNTVSFEVASNPTLFFRHYDRIFYIDHIKKDQYFPSDSSFYIESGGTRQTQSFFDDTPDPLYPSQRMAIQQGIGPQLDSQTVPFTQTGIEQYSTAVYKDIAILVYYAVMDPWTRIKPLSADWEWSAYTIANYTFNTTQTVQATITLDCATKYCYYLTGVNTSLTGGPMIKQMRKYNGPKTNFGGGPRPGPQSFQVKGATPTIIKNAIHGSNYSFTLNPTPRITIVRDPKAPFLRFEVFTDPEFQFDSVFTEIRFPEIANITYPGMKPQFQNSETDILRIPGTTGAITLNKTQVNINYVSGSAWASASFVFNITSILPCDQTSSCPLLTIGTQTGSGYQIAVYGSTTGSMNLVVQPRSANGSIVSTSVPIPIQPSLWYMATITPTELTLYSINTNTNMSTKVGTISLGNAQNTGNASPLLQIGSQTSSLDFSVAWLHLFDKTITTVDPVLELQGYPTGIF